MSRRAFVAVRRASTVASPARRRLASAAAACAPSYRRLRSRATSAALWFRRKIGPRRSPVIGERSIGPLNVASRSDSVPFSCGSVERAACASTSPSILPLAVVPFGRRATKFDSSTSSARTRTGDRAASGRLSVRRARCGSERRGREHACRAPDRPRRSHTVTARRSASISRRNSRYRQARGTGRTASAIASRSRGGARVPSMRRRSRARPLTGGFLPVAAKRKAPKVANWCYAAASASGSPSRSPNVPDAIVLNNGRSSAQIESFLVRATPRRSLQRAGPSFDPPCHRKPRRAGSLRCPDSFPRPSSARPGVR